MSNNTLKARIQHLHKTEAEWNVLADFVPNAGELIIYDADQNYATPRFKFGDGSTKVAVLPFIGVDIDINKLEISFDAGRITSYTE
jgi:hypothetical protein